MENCSDDEEIQCMELLEGNYQLFMNWPNSSSSAGGGGRVVGGGGVVRVESGLYGEGCSASSNSSVTGNLPINLFGGSSNRSSMSPPPPAPYPPPPPPPPPISNPLAANPFWHSIKSRPLIKTAIVRYLFVQQLQFIYCPLHF